MRALVLLAALVLSLALVPVAGAASVSTMRPGQKTISVNMPSGYALLSIRAFGCTRQGRHHERPNTLGLLDGPASLLVSSQTTRPEWRGIWIPAGTYRLTVQTTNCGATLTLTRPHVPVVSPGTPPPRI